MQDNSRKRHIAKAITWRLVGTIDTIVLSWVISGNPFTGLKIGLAEVTTKMLLYYFHERVWFRIYFQNSNKRHLLKTFTWRFVGTIDTMVLAWVITGNPLTGFKIGAAEVFTKMLLYFLHEKVWHKSSYGLEKHDTQLEK
ncbi:DUF2061 domain-containing protein [Subsaxibacter sp. CAU 1640]|uniref:DUF2061 domain-containing protein n=1 Tax=Subsaxibacter sp. CAU 1640 TaxID=2933271 RepID=UPI00200590E5|nr:DUF2061 domain-containing protein [Subsaxibacter sp. CAU 1640]MCK7589521.1 DUF2061 domain-containing protein [Subsaxibacter sp. CAU 1640]